MSEETTDVMDASEEIASLREQVADQQSKLMMAAEMGQGLLQKTQRLEQRLAAATSDAEQKEAQIQALQVELREAQQASAGSPQETPTDDALGDKVEALETRVRLLMEQLTEAESANQKLLEDLSGKEATVTEMQDSVRAKEQLDDEVLSLTTTVQQMKAQVEQEQGKTKAAEARAAALLEELSSAKISLERSSTAYTAEVAKVAAAAEAIEAANRANDDLKHQLATALQSTADASTTTRQFQNSMAGLAKENARLMEEKQELDAFVQQLKRDIDTYRQQKDAAEASLGESGGGGLSLMDQLSSQIGERAPEPAEEPPVAQGKEDKDAPAGAPDNCREYFLIAQTAVMIGLALRHPHKSDEVFTVRGSDLYNQCIQEGVPFHEWHVWISRTLRRRLRTDQQQQQQAQHPGQPAQQQGVQSPQRGARASPKKGGFWDRLKSGFK